MFTATTEHFLRIAERAALLSGLAMLIYWAASLITIDLHQSEEAREFLKIRPSAVPPSQIKPQAMSDGALVGRLEVPRLGLSTFFVEGDSAADLKRGAGHIPGTSLPGRSGNTAIAAHRDTFFRPLRLIRTKDIIVVTTLDGTFQYRVIRTQVVKPDHIQVLSPTKQQTLTLITCYPFNFLGPAPERFVVQAERC